MTRQAMEPRIPVDRSGLLALLADRWVADRRKARHWRGVLARHASGWRR